MNNTLSNGLSLLMFLANNPQKHKVSDIAKGMNLPNSHAHRLLQTLVEHHYVVKTDGTKYQIGIGALRLGHSLLVNIPIRQYALPILQKEISELKSPLTLSLPFKHQGIVVAHVSPNGVIRNTIDSIGTVLSSYSSASGKLFFSNLSKTEQEDIFKTLQLTPRGPHTHRTIDSLKKDLEKIAAEDLSISYLENGPEMVAIAVPIKNSQGDVSACLGISDKEEFIPKSKYETIITSLKKIALQIQSFYERESYAN